MPSTLSVLLLPSMANGPTGGSVPVNHRQTFLEFLSLLGEKFDGTSFHVNVSADSMNHFWLREEGGSLSAPFRKSTLTGRRPVAGS